MRSWGSRPAVEGVRGEVVADIRVGPGPVLLGHRFQQRHGDLGLGVPDVRQTGADLLGEPRVLQTHQRTAARGSGPGPDPARGPLVRVPGLLDRLDERLDERRGQQHAVGEVLAHVPSGHGLRQRRPQLDGQPVALGERERCQQQPQGLRIGAQPTRMQIERLADAAGQQGRIRRIEALGLQEQRLHGELEGQPVAVRAPAEGLGKFAAHGRVGGEGELRRPGLGVERRLGVQHQTLGVGPLRRVEIDDLRLPGRQRPGQRPGQFARHIGEQLHRFGGGERLEHVPYQAGRLRPRHGPVRPGRRRAPQPSPALHERRVRGRSLHRGPRSVRNGRR